MPSMSIRTVSDDGLSEVQTSDDLLRVVHAVTKLVLDMLEAPGSAAVENLAQLGADVVQQWRWTPPAHDIIYPPAPPVRPGQPSQLRPTDGEMRGWVSFFVGHLRQNFVPVVLSQHLANEQYYGDYAYAEFPRADWATDSMARCNQQAWATGRSLTSQELQEVMRDWEPWRAGCMVIKLEMLESLAELRSAYLNTPNSHPKYSKRAEVYRTTLTFQAIMAIHELVHCFVGFLGGWGPRVLTPVSIIPPQYTACLRETEDPIVTAGCTPRGEAGRTWEDRVLGGIASLCYLPTNPGDVPVAQLLITDSNNRTRLVNPKAVERFVKRDFKFPLDIIGDWAAPVGYTAVAGGAFRKKASQASQKHVRLLGWLANKRPPSCACFPLVIPKTFPIGRVGGGPSPGSRHGSSSPSRSTASLPCSPGRKTPETARVNSRGGTNTTNNGCGPKAPARPAHPVAPHSRNSRAVAAVGHAGGVPSLSRGTPLKLIIPQEQGHTPTGPTRKVTGPVVVNNRPPQSRDAKGGVQSSVPVRGKPGGVRAASPLASSPASSAGPSPQRKAVVLTAAQGHQKTTGAISAAARSPVARTRVAPQGPGGTA